MLQAKLDDLGKAGWLAILVLAFWSAWPLGLMVLAYLAGSGRLRLWWAETPGGWVEERGGFSRSRRRGRAWQGWQMSSGNRAFDDYRADTLRRLEEEQREFKSFLERLRRARDKAEFDQFMAERRRAADDAAPATPAPTDAPS